MLGIHSTAMGFIAGFVGEEIERQVKQLGIDTDFIKIENDTSRINVKILTELEETAINSIGPFIDQISMKLLLQKIEKIQGEDTLILAGSIPQGVSENIYQNICEKLSSKGTRIMVDATGDLLLNTLPFHPFLIKPNQEELGEMFHIKILSQEDAFFYAKKLQEKGAKNVLVSMGSQGSILLDENGKKYKKEVIHAAKKINTVGAGDSMVAGFIAGFELYGDYEKALDLGTATATATVNSISLATKEEIDKILRQEFKWYK